MLALDNSNKTESVERNFVDKTFAGGRDYDGENIFFSQRYGASWEKLPYWEGFVDFNGCGLIALTMCINITTGSVLTPEQVYNMRKAEGIDQSHVASKDGKSICGGDVQFQFNPVNRKLFGIESCPLERSIEAFKITLSKENTVIWASSRNTDFYDKEGNPRWIYNGHVLCIWKYVDGNFWIKDPGLPEELGNNVLYAKDVMKQWLSGWEYQQFEVRKYSE